MLRMSANNTTQNSNDHNSSLHSTTAASWINEIRREKNWNIWFLISISRCIHYGIGTNARASKRVSERSSARPSGTQKHNILAEMLNTFRRHTHTHNIDIEVDSRREWDADRKKLFEIRCQTLRRLTLRTQNEFNHMNIFNDCVAPPSGNSVWCVRTVNSRCAGRDLDSRKRFALQQ